MHPAASRRAWRSRISAAGVAVLLIAACSEGEDRANTATKDATGGDVSTSADGREPWCDEFHALLRSGDFSDIDLAEVPEEIRAAIRFLARTHPEGETGGKVAGAVEAQATAEAWGHEHCNGPHPFCSLWTTVAARVDAAAQLGEEAAPAIELEHFFGELDDDLVQYAPDELVDAVKDYLVSVDSLLGGPTPDDYDDGDAEVAIDALEHWVASSTCAT